MPPFAGVTSPAWLHCLVSLSDPTWRTMLICPSLEGQIGAMYLQHPVTFRGSPYKAASESNLGQVHNATLSLQGGVSQHCALMSCRNTATPLVGEGASLRCDPYQINGGWAPSHAPSSRVTSAFNPPCPPSTQPLVTVDTYYISSAICSRVICTCSFIETD